MSIGHRGMEVASRTLARTAVVLFQDPKLVRAARAEFESRRGNFQYKPLLGDRDPPLNYRD
jgi:aminobenzoyl-glutamate utilization protein B